MARVSHPCVEIEGCGYAAFTETDPLHPQFGKLILTEKISADPCNLLECAPDGLLVPDLSPPDAVIVPPVTATRSTFALTSPGSPPSVGSPALVVQASLNYTVPAGCGSGAPAQIRASLNNVQTFNFNYGDTAFWVFRVTGWTIGAATGGLTPIGTATHISAGPLTPSQSNSWPTFTQNGSVVAGDTIAVAAQLIFFGLDNGITPGLWSFAIQSPATITLEAQIF